MSSIFNDKNCKFLSNTSSGVDFEYNSLIKLESSQQVLDLLCKISIADGLTNEDKVVLGNQN